jgi:predicted DNA-binding transcriptional regulator AlpA
VTTNHEPSTTVLQRELNATGLLSERQLAVALGVSRATLRRWRTERRGPRYMKISALVRYRTADIKRWLASSEIETEEGR